MTVGDNFFGSETGPLPLVTQIQPGDTVDWHWANTGNQHTVTSKPSNQTLRLRSGLHDGKFDYRKTFTKRGRFTYYCEVHPFTMQGAVAVGPPPFPDTLLPAIGRLKAKVAGHTVTLSFRLSEKAKVRVSVRGPTRKSVRKTLRKGKRRVNLRGLRAGRYQATLVATDEAGNKSRVVKVKFRVR